MLKHYKNTKNGNVLTKKYWVFHIMFLRGVSKEEAIASFDDRVYFGLLVRHPVN